MLTFNVFLELSTPTLKQDVPSRFALFVCLSILWNSLGYESTGNEIVYSSYTGDKFTLFIINKDGTNNRQITNWDRI